MPGASVQWHLALALAFREIGEDLLDIARDAAVKHGGGFFEGREEGPQFALDAATSVACLERDQGRGGDGLLELVKRLAALDTPGHFLGDLLDVAAELGQHGLASLD